MDQTTVSTISRSVATAVGPAALAVNQAVPADAPTALRLVRQATHLRAASHARRHHRLSPLSPPRQTTTRPHKLAEHIRAKAHQRARTPVIHHRRLRGLYQSPLTRVHELPEEPDIGSTALGRSGARSPAVSRSRSEQGRHRALDHTRQSRTRHHPRQHRQCVLNALGTVGSALWRQDAAAIARTARHGRLSTSTFEHMYRIAFCASRNNPRNRR